jgi:hypothetical protein
MPAAIGDFLILDAIRESGGTALAVSDADPRRAAEMGRAEGLFVAPEAAATLAALRRLVQDGQDLPRRARGAAHHGQRVEVHAFAHAELALCLPPPPRG